MPPVESASTVKRFRFLSLDGKDDGAEQSEASLPADPVSSVPPPGPLPLPLALPAITENDVRTARAEGLAQGTREGYAAAQAKFNKDTAAREDALKSLLEIIANRITLAAETHAHAMQEHQALMARLVIAAARKVAGEALKKEPYAAVETLLRESTGLIAGEASITVVVSDALAPGLRQRIDMVRPMLHGFNGTLTVKEDAALMDQDCRVEWTGGYSERSAEDLWRTIEGIIAGTNINS